MTEVCTNPRKPKPLKAKTKVWVVIHCEWFQLHDSVPNVDEMVFHVSSTKGQAERYMRRAHMSAYSWWKIQQFGVNENNDEGPTFYYTHTGAAIKRPPYKKAETAFIKWKKENPDLF